MHARNVCWSEELGGKAVGMGFFQRRKPLLFPFSLQSLYLHLLILPPSFLLLMLATFLLYSFQTRLCLKTSVCVHAIMNPLDIYLFSYLLFLLHTSLHSYAYIHSYIATLMHSYIYTFIHHYIQTSLQSYIHVFIHSYIPTFIYP